MTRSEFYIRKDFAFYDSCAASVVGHPVLYTYELLRRFIARARAHGSFARKLQEDGFVVAVVSQRKLAAMIGTTRQPTIAEHMRKLVAMGWVEVAKNADTTECVYVLGQRIRDAKGREYEGLYADAWLASLWERLEESSAQAWGTTWVESEEGRYEALVKPITATTPEWRIGICKQHLGLGDDAGNTNESAEITEEASDSEDEAIRSSVQGYTPESIGGYTPQRIPLYAGAYTISREEEVKKIEVEKEEFLRSRKARSATISNGKISSAEDEGRGREKEREEKRGALSHLDKPSRFRLGSGESVKTMDRVVRHSEPQVRKAPVVQNSVQTSESGAPVEERISAIDRIVATAKAQAQANRSAQLAKEAARAQKMANLKGGDRPIAEKKVTKSLEDRWTVLMKARFPTVVLAAWGAKERGQIKLLTEKYPSQIVGLALDYVVTCWEPIQQRLFKGKGSVPTIGVILKLHELLVVEAQQWAEWQQVKQEWDQWWKDNPSDPYPPQELEERHAKLLKQVASLGIQA